MHDQQPLVDYSPSKNGDLMVLPISFSSDLAVWSSAGYLSALFIPFHFISKLLTPEPELFKPLNEGPFA